jgi:hypothetical protein
VLTATLKGPDLAPSTRLKNDLEGQGIVGVSGQQPHPIFRPERASPKGHQRLKSGRSAVRPCPDHQIIWLLSWEDVRFPDPGTVLLTDHEIPSMAVICCPLSHADRTLSHPCHLLARHLWPSTLPG